MFFSFRCMILISNMGPSISLGKGKSGLIVFGKLGRLSRGNTLELSISIKSTKLHTTSSITLEHLNPDDLGLGTRSLEKNLVATSILSALKSFSRVINVILVQTFSIIFSDLKKKMGKIFELLGALQCTIHS